MTKVLCKSCGVAILKDTAERNDGNCLPCRSGTRERIEASKLRYREERESEKTDPLRKLWLDLVRRAHTETGGFDSFSQAERLYFAVGLLEGEVYNGGFDQYFLNSSADYYRYAIEGLQAMNAPNSLELLQRAKQVVFGFEEPDQDTGRRRMFLRRAADASRSKRLDSLDSLFYDDPDSLGEKIEQYARDQGLITRQPGS